MGFNTKVIGQKFGPFHYEYDWKSVALYALASGATDQELDLLLETRGPKVLPTYSVVASFEALFSALTQLGGNIATVVHGAQKCVAHRPLLPSGALKVTASVQALYDKGKGALAVLATEIRDTSEVLVAETEWQILFRGEGGFGGERGPEAPVHSPPPGTSPSHRVEMTTAPTQALLYRLASFDMNPIHADPAFALAVGFPRPILHGLCTFAHAARAVINSLCGGDPDRLRSIEGRFSKPVLPGDTLRTEIFEMQPGEALFQTATQRAPEPVISFGRVEYRAS